MIKMRPHHLVDIIRDYGNDVKRGPHPFGASLAEVTDDILADINQEVEFLIGVDSICATCSKLENGTCTAAINDQLMMQVYNDGLDAKLFSALKMKPGVRMPVAAFLRMVNDHMEILDLFDSPDNDPVKRLRGVKKALVRLGIAPKSPRPRKTKR